MKPQSMLFKKNIAKKSLHLMTMCIGKESVSPARWTTRGVSDDRKGFINTSSPSDIKEIPLAKPTKQEILC